MCTVHQRVWFALMKESEEDSWCFVQLCLWDACEARRIQEVSQWRGEVWGAWLVLAGDAGV